MEEESLLRNANGSARRSSENNNNNNNNNSSNLLNSKRLNDLISSTGFSPQRRECMMGLAAVAVVVVVLALVCSLFTPSMSPPPTFGGPNSIQSQEERRDAAFGRVYSKATTGGQEAHSIPEENSSRAAVIERIAKKAGVKTGPQQQQQESSAAEHQQQGSDDSGSSASVRADDYENPEESDIVQGKSINPRFAKKVFDDDSGNEKQQNFIVRDILGIIGAIAILGAFIPQQAHLLRTKDVSSFSLPALALLFVGSLCFAFFYWASHAWGIALLCMWIAANTFVILAMKYRFDPHDGGDMPLLSKDQHWRGHEVL